MKRLASFLLALLLLISVVGCTAQTSQQSAINPSLAASPAANVGGDINGDGTESLLDVIAALKASVAQAPDLRADMNGDGAAAAAAADLRCTM